MPRYSYGLTTKKRARQLLETLLDYASEGLDDELLPLEFRWSDKDYNNPRLLVRTTLSMLEKLTVKDKLSKKLSKDQIRTAIIHLRDFLGILEDQRLKTKGSDEWIFTLKLWSKDKEENLRKFDIEWDSRRAEKTESPELNLRIYESSTIRMIDEPSRVRNILLNLNDREEIIQAALSLVRQKTNAKIASVFLFSKDGILERVAIDGVDKDNYLIDNYWFSDEKYQVGEGITGSAAKSRENTGYGNTKIALNLNDKKIINYHKSKYLERLEEIKCMIAIPLNGQSKTYGVLEVINDSSLFSPDELAWLSAIQSYLATALSNFRRDRQTKILTDLGKMLVNFDDSIINFDNKLGQIYEQVAHRLVSSYTSFKVCIIRTIDESTGKIRVRACAGSKSVSWENRLNHDRNYGEGLVGKTIKTREARIIENIAPVIHLFRNKEWILNQGFKSFACFPLITKKDVLGTLSLYVGYNYNFHKSCRFFLESVTDQLAAFEENIRQSKRVKECKELIHKQVDNEFNREFVAQALDAVDIDKEVKIEQKYQEELEAKNREIDIYRDEINYLRILVSNLTEKKDNI